MNLIKTVFWLLLGRWTYNLISLVSFGIIVAKIDVSDYGIFAIASTVLIFTDVFYNEIGENIVIKSKGDRRDVLTSSLISCLTFAGIVTVVILGLAPLISAAYESKLLFELLIALSQLSWLQAISYSYRGTLINLGKIKHIALIVSASNLIGATIGVLLVYQNYGVWSLVAQQFAIQIITSALCIHFSKIAPTTKINKSTLIVFYKFSGKGFLSSLLNVLTNRLDVIAASIFFGTIGAGYFGLAKRLIQILQDLVGSSFDKAFLLISSKLSAQAEPSTTTANTYTQALSTQIIASIPTFIGFAIISPFLIPMMFGTNWEGTSSIIIAMSIGGIGRTLSTLPRAELMRLNRLNAILTARFMDLIIASLLIMLTSPISLFALGLAFSFRYILSFTILQKFVHDTTQISISKILNQIFYPTLSAVGMIVACLTTSYFLHHHIPDGYLLCALFFSGASSYIAIMYLTRLRWLSDYYSD